MLASIYLVQAGIDRKVLFNVWKLNSSFSNKTVH